MRGGALNVGINLPSLPDGDPLVAEASADLDRLLAGLDERERQVRELVEERLA
jgi:hypothetical protein